MLDSICVLKIAVDLCEALRCIESNGILHRNIKPSNILIDGTGDRKVARLNDLVLAKPFRTSQREQQTRAGEILAGISYMSPEQLGSGHPVDGRSDIYQLGVTLYTLVTGREPFSTGATTERIKTVLTEVPKPVRHFHIGTSPQFDSLVSKMLKKNPNERFQNATELADALRKTEMELGENKIHPRRRDADDEGWGGALNGLF